MTFKEIKDLIKLIDDSNLAEFKMENESIKITVRTKDYVQGKSTTIIQQHPEQMRVAPLAAPVATTAAEAPEKIKAEEETNYLEVTSPIVGTFYRSSSPEKPPFIKVGDTIAVGDTVCIVEAMKLFNDIESEVSGKVVKVVIEDASPVEYGQVLFLVDPNG